MTNGALQPMPSTDKLLSPMRITNLISGTHSIYLNPLDERDPIMFRMHEWPSLQHAFTSSLVSSSSEAETLLKGVSSYKAVGIANDIIKDTLKGLTPETAKEWYDHVQKNLTMMVAQKFGGIPDAPSYYHKLLSGIRLIETGNAEIVHEVYSCDNVLGLCMCNKCKETSLGSNMLGETYQRVREELKKCFGAFYIEKDGGFDDSCHICWNTEGKVKLGARRLVRWAPSGLQQFAYCHLHHKEMREELDKDGGVYYSFDIGTSSYSNTGHGTGYGSGYSSSNWNPNNTTPSYSTYTTSSSKDRWGCKIKLPDGTVIISEVNLNDAA